MISSLEEGLFDIEYTINVEHRHDVESSVLKQVDIVLIIMDDTMKELENDIEGHLDGDSLTSVMGSRNEHSWTLSECLRSSLESDQRNLAALIRLSEARDSDVIGELLCELVDDYERVMVAVVVSKTRDKQLVFDSIAKLIALLHLLSEGRFPGDVFLSISITLDLHDELFDLCKVTISIGNFAKDSQSSGILCKL